MIGLSALVFALSWWLGLYLLARDPRNVVGLLKARPARARGHSAADAAHRADAVPRRDQTSRTSHRAAGPVAGPAVARVWWVVDPPAAA